MTRRKFTRKTKREAFERCGGRCEGCGILFRAGINIEYDHRSPDYFEGPNTLENCQVLCRPCHVLKTGGDMKNIARAERILYKAAGMRGKSLRGRPMPGTKASGIKKKLDGTIIRRSE